MAFLWHYARRRPALHLAAVGSVMLAASFACSAQYALKLLVDAMSGAPQAASWLWWAFSGYLGIIGIECLLWRFGALFGQRAIIADKAEARLDLFNHVSGHSGRYLSDQLGGALANRISSTGDSLQQVMTNALFTIIPVCTDFCAALLMLSAVDWRLAAVLCGYMVVIGTMVGVFGQRGAPRHLAYAERAAGVGGELVDVLSNLWVVKAFSARSRERARFSRLLDEEAAAQRASITFVEGMRIVYDCSLWLVAAGMLTWSIYLWSTGHASPGDVILTSALSFRILNGSRDMAFAIVNSTQFVSRIAESIRVLGEDHHVVDRPGAGKLIPLGGSVSFEGVGFAYPGQAVFDDFTLHIDPGQRVGLIGPSGAGKSTLIALVQRLADVEIGRVLIDDQDVRGMTQDSLRAAIAVVPQDITLFHRSVLENIRYARPDATEEDVVAAARAARCDEFIRRLPQGYDTVVGDRGSKLSGGQRQRIGIARALLKDAPIIVLDEATSALDSESEQEIQRALHALMQGRTVLAIAHRLSTVANFDRVVVLREGRIVEDGAPAELRRHRGLFDRMCRLQEGSATGLADAAAMLEEQSDAQADAIAA